MKRFQKVLRITINCALFFLLACPAAWLLDREIQTVKSALGIGREAKIKNWLDEAEKSGDAWSQWKYCRRVLARDPRNGAALALKSRIASGYARKARDLMIAGRTRDAILELVLAIRVDHRTSYYWVWMDNWVKAYREEKRNQPAPAPNR